MHYLHWAGKIILGASEYISGHEFNEISSLPICVYIKQRI